MLWHLGSLPIGDLVYDLWFMILATRATQPFIMKYFIKNSAKYSK